MYTRINGVPVELDDEILSISEKFENVDSGKCVVPSCYYIMIALTFAISVAIIASLCSFDKKSFFGVVGFILALCILALVWCLSAI